MNIKAYWEAALQQNADKMRTYFHPDAKIRWHNTNEEFTLEEFIQANCEYPDRWDGEIERLIQDDDLIITAVHVYAKHKPLSFHVTSFIQLKNDAILSIDEYWGDDGEIPQWRIKKQIGKPIR